MSSEQGHSMREKPQTLHWTLLVIYLLFFVWSAINPKDRLTWFLEVFPAMLGLAIMVYTYKRFPLTPLLYILIIIHCVILMIGGHYTYAEVPLFDQLKEWMGSSRNNYDKVGHFAQGFVPAIIAREIVIRHHVFNSQRWQVFFIISFCLGFSAFYELLEWWVAVASGDDAVKFLATQGYEWDTQSDMWYALVGAMTSLLLLSRLHDKQLSGFNL